MESQAGHDPNLYVARDGLFLPVIRALSEARERERGAESIRQERARACRTLHRSSICKVQEESVSLGYVYPVIQLAEPIVRER